MTDAALVDVGEIRGDVLRINDLLAPLATRPVVFEELERWVRGHKMQNPLESLGVKEGADVLVERLVAAYDQGPESIRSDIRNLLKEAAHFAWASVVVTKPTTRVGFRKHLLWISACDTNQDPRDVALILDRLCWKARLSGVRVRPVLLEVAHLSNGDPGHIRQLLLRKAEPLYLILFKAALGRL